MSKPEKRPPGFMVYRETLQLVLYAPPEKVGTAMIAAAKLFLRDKESVIEDDQTGDIFEELQRSIESGTEKYLEVCKRNKENAERRWKDPG